MSALDLALVAAGAALGAPLRLVVATRLDGRLPWGTAAVNVVGSFVLGVAVGLGAAGGTLALVGTGFCGGLTTYSALAVQTHALGPRRGAAYAGATLLAGLLACAAGFGLAQA